MTKEALTDYAVEDKSKDKNKNIFALGFLAFALDTSIEKTKDILKNKFKVRPIRDDGSSSRQRLSLC
jgi:hypothetical protein